MKLMVPVKRVIDYNVKVRVKSDHSDVDLANVKMALNPFCEIAVEEALRLKESGAAEEVVVISVGRSVCQEQLRTALAMGADRAILVEADLEPDPLGVAKALMAVHQKEEFDLAFFGKQGIDGDHSQTGQMFAALAGLPQGTFAYKVELIDGRVQVVREIDGGLQTVALSLPAVVTVDLRLNEPRYASLPNIMKAKKKPMEIIPAADLQLNLEPRVKTLRVEPPVERSAGVRVGDVDELLDKLRSEAKVI